jgi:hypothetical protein
MSHHLDTQDVPRINVCDFYLFAGSDLGRP